MKLNQVIAVEKGVKGRAHSEISELYKQVQKPALFNGLVRSYTPKEEGGETYPSEDQAVQCTVSNVLKKLRAAKVELFDTVATKDVTNMSAKADVVVDGEVILKDAPVPYLLFLEKEVTDLRSLIQQLPVLDSSDRWSVDSNSGLHKSETVIRNTTKKIQKPIVLYHATENHPAQTQLVTEDVVVGSWEQTKVSGAVAQVAKDEMLVKADALLKAVKMAREEANQAEVEPVYVGAKIFDYLLK